MNILFIVLAIVVLLIVVRIVNSRGVAQVNVTQAREMVKDSGVTVLDVRTPPEFNQGHLEGAKLIPVAELKDRISELASPKDRPVLVYCHSGNRSLVASTVLRKNGFTKISNLKGGIIAWNNAGYKIVK
jgi:rhodanese-related sulfurtransferase